MSPTSKKRLRINGVVRIMNQVRARWQAGISKTEAEELLGLARSTTTQVEKICREHKIRPDALPAPTLRAYRYLKGLDLRNLPPPGKQPATTPAPPTAPRVRIRNLVSFCAALQKELHIAALGGAGRSTHDIAQVQGIQERIGNTLAAIEKLDLDTQLDLAGLPAPSRRAYLWLEFLSLPANLEQHLRAVGTASQTVQKSDCVSHLGVRRNSLPAQIEFYSIPALYRARITGGVLRIVANEGYISAPAQVIEALVCAARVGVSRGGNKNTPYLGRIKDFAHDPAFHRIALAVEHGPNSSPGNSAIPSDNGYAQDPRLQAIFERINLTYFDGKMPQPRLTWNMTITHRKLGHYQESTDTVMISQTLDQPGVPDYILDFVMYHELLHKKLGMQLKNGRRFAHTPAFRAEERKFSRYAEAKAFLDNLGKHLRL